MKFLALDVGHKRIGVATCDGLEIAASPHSIVKAGKKAIEDVLKIIDHEEIHGIVIGLPISFDGQERESCQRARAFKNQLAEKTDLPIDFVDERFTTKIAEASLVASGLNREKRKEVKDAVAASVILQGYLDSRRSKGKQITER